MKKIIVGSLVGGLLIFIWQTLSWTALDLHRSAQNYTPKQDSILAYLNTQFSETGSYFLPNLPAGASGEEQNKLMESSMNKPWVQIHYHKAQTMNMGLNIARGFIVDIFMVSLLCWIISQFKTNSFFTTFFATILTGIIAYINVPYTNHIWYEWADIRMYLLDTAVSWSLCGIWLGWWMNRK